MKKKTVSRAIHKKLPYSGRPSIRWSSFLFKWWWNTLGKSGKDVWRPIFYINTRIANGYNIQIGPVCIFWPARWLEDPARHSYPEVFND